VWDSELAGFPGSDQVWVADATVFAPATAAAAWRTTQLSPSWKPGHRPELLVRTQIRTKIRPPLAWLTSVS